MKRDCLTHPKTRELAATLDIPLPHAVGLLSFLWDFTGTYCPAGNIGGYSDRLIEDSCHWTGAQNALVGALLAHRWIDEHETYRLVVHDWSEHCEDWIHRKLVRTCSLFWDGREPSLSRSPASERERYATQRQQNQLLMPLAPDMRPKCAPALALALALAVPCQALPNNPPTPRKRGKRVCGLSPDQQVLFDAFYAAYPKKVAVAEAEKAWSEINPNTELADMIRVGSEKYLAFCLVQQTEHRFKANPATWLRDKRWKDDYGDATKRDRSESRDNFIP